MSQNAHADLRVRLEALHADLHDGTGDAPCSSHVGRLFNALLPLVKQQFPDDPVLWTVGPLKLEEEERPSLATVRVLVGQLVAALSLPETATAEEAPTRSKERSKPDA